MKCGCYPLSAGEFTHMEKPGMEQTELGNPWSQYAALTVCKVNTVFPIAENTYLGIPKCWTSTLNRDFMQCYIKSDSNISLN